MEISEGMYVRTEKGEIKKVFQYDNQEENLIWCTLNSCATLKSSIVKASYNIIDLIQIGDILLIKDFVDEASMIFTDMYYIQNENQLFNIKRDLEKNKNMKISKILTKEQMESMAYEVEK